MKIVPLENLAPYGVVVYEKRICYVCFPYKGKKKQDVSDEKIMQWNVST